MAENASRGGGGGVLAVLLIVGFVFFYLQSIEDSPSGETSGSAGAEPEEPEESVPATPDALTQALMDVPVGSCLRNYYSGDGWGDQLPRTAPCDRVDAFFQVTHAGVGGECLSGGSRAEWWQYSSYHGDSYGLCLRRWFQAEQCFLGTVSGSGEEQAVSGNLSSAWPCDTDTVPEAGNQILRITGHYRAPPDPADRHCTSDPYDGARYYRWDVNGGESFICAVITD